MNEIMDVVYIAGFGSSHESSKFRYLVDNAEALGISPRIFAPDYARDTMTEIVQQAEVEITPDTLLVGHSLGGYIARMVAQTTRCRAILLNPSFYPDRTLGNKVYRVHDYTENDIGWRSRTVEPPAEYVLVETGDKVVDWISQEPLNAQSWLGYIGGGDHRFQTLSFLGDIITKVKNTPWQ